MEPNRLLMMIYTFIKPVVARFVKREKRFFGYFVNNDGKFLTAHCVNTGKMSDLLVPNNLSILSRKDSGKLMYTWEAVSIGGVWIGTNTATPNKLVESLIKGHLIEGLKNETFKKEVTFAFPEKTYRADFASDNTVIEVKNVHWVQGDRAYFPDCVTARASEQVNILIKLKQMGKRVIIIYIVQRNDVNKLSISKDIDPRYHEQIQKARNVNVEFYAFNCRLCEESIVINKKMECI